MYTRRIKFLTASLIVLIAASALYYVFSSSGQFKSRLLFPFRELPDSVLLYQGNTALHLVKASTGWMVNNQPADADRINLLLATLQQSVARRRVAQSQLDSINRLLDESGVRVEVFSNGKQLFSFRVTGNERSMKTFIRPDEEETVEVTIPGYRVYVAAIFSLPETEWLDRRIFNFNWRNFESLSAEFPNNPSDNFNVVYNGRFFSVRDLPTDTARLNSYLDEISLMEADAFLPVHHLPDSLASASPLSRIRVYSVSRDTLSLDVYRAGDKMLGVSRHLPVSVLSASKVQVLTRKRNWFRAGEG
ncbi:MAG: DUF4340 domain-containing protein [Cyclobacteriaceae bacterium]|nr:DUF4340 domain-containing protein [Cyclobacteriaceae bacterium]